MTTATQHLPVPFLDLGAMQQDVQAELDAAWRDVTGASAFVGGPHLERFEQEWAAYCSTTHALGVGNGTDAIELALLALGVGPGHEVVVPANTFIATAEAVVATGAVPHFVDVDPDTLLIDPDAVAAAIGPRTAAVIAVHLFGQVADMDAVLAVADSAGVPVVEDVAQAHGATWNGRRAGSFGAVGCFSFYPGKNLGAFGDGGALVTDDEQVARAVRSLSDHGRSLESKHDHPKVGRNSRLDGLQAAVLSAKLPWLDRWNDGRRAADRLYREQLQDAPFRLVAQRPESESVFHLEVARVPERDRVRAALADRGIGTGIHYPVPCHEHPPYAGFPRGALPVVEAAAREILSLPMHPHLSEQQVRTVSAALLEESEGLGEPRA